MARLMALVVFLAGLSSASGTEPIRLTHDGRVKRDPTFVGSSGKSIIYTLLERPTQLRLMKLAAPGEMPQPLHSSETRSEFEPTVSSDGRFVSFVQNRGNLSLALVIEDSLGTQSAEIPPGGGFSGMHSPTFSPDGSRILFSYPEDGRQRIYAVDIQGKNRQVIIDSVGVNNWPHFSPDGRRIVFASSRDDDFEVYIANADGTEPKRLTTTPRQDIRPRISPDGKRIAFTSNRDGNYEIYVMNVDGSNVTRVTDHPEQDDYPAWHADGRQLMIVSERQGQFDLYLIDTP